MTTLDAADVVRPTWEDYSKCIHCGLCLNACPTYRLLGVEPDSPRGRIHQMILVEEGRLKLGDSFVRHIDLCLDCRACETACPSGVQYGKLVEAARAQIEQHHRRPLFSRLLRSLGLRHLLPYPRRLALVARLLRFYQRSGAQTLVRRSGLLRWLGKLGAAEKFLPRIDDRFFFSQLGRVFPAEGERRARVAFFAGCMQQVAFTQLNQTTIRVLQKNGCDVIVPAGQVCCGALHVHAGVRDVARRLARQNLDAFATDDFDAIITNTAGCGSTLKEYDQLFPDDEKAKQKAEQFQDKMRDVTEFLAALGLRPPEKEVRLRVTCQDSCHLLHGQKVRHAPRELLRAIPGIELVEMKLADHCCGSAGIYNLLHPEIAGELLAEKMEHARATSADVIVTANPGCILQLRAGVEQFGTGQQVLHVVELLDRAYGKQQ
ncbi:MAG: (Fe-S)-binding protein [Acidobacteria bacterium]|nr:(Fe-S)-binding protein [Acidobacteriota bacterium]